MAVVTIPSELHGKIKKFARKKRTTIMNVIERLINGEALDIMERSQDGKKDLKYNSESIMGTQIQPENKEQKITNQTNPSNNPVNEPTKSIEDKKVTEVIESKEKKENIGEAEENPIPKNKEKMMQEQDMEVVKQIVNTFKDGIDTKLANQEKAYEQAIGNLAGKIDSLKASPESITKEPTKIDIVGEVNKALRERDTNELRKREEARKAEEEEKLKNLLTKVVNGQEEIKKMTEQQKKDFDSFCSLNPEDERCKKFIEILTTKQTDKATKPKEVKTSEQAIANVINSLKLPVMKKEIREGMKPKEIDERTTNAAKLVEQLNVTSVDMLNVLNRHPDDKKGIALYVAGDQELAEEVLKRSDVKAKIEGCNLGDEKQCKLADEVLSESGLALVKKNKKGNRYQFINPKLNKGTGF